MKWEIHSDRPVYLQLMDLIQNAIIAGIYAPGERLPSVRELAQEAGVNPNTMQKALSELERSGIVHSRRTSGRFITEDEQLIHDLKYERAVDNAKAFIRSMKDMGLNVHEIQEIMVKLFLEDDQEENDG